MAKYDLLLKGGHVIDPANDIDGPRDVGISGRSVGAVESGIPESDARRVARVDGWYVTPGLIDLHAHCTGFELSMFPDEMCFPNGVTTMVDCGGSGWRTFDEFDENVVQKSDVRVFGLLNIVGRGMQAPAEQDISDMDPGLTAETIMRRSDVLVGVKVAHFRGRGWESIDRGVRAAELTGTFCLIDQNPLPNRTFAQMLLEHMQAGRWRHPLLRLQPADDRQRRQGQAALPGGARARCDVRRGARQQQLLLFNGVACNPAGFSPGHDLD